MAISIAIIVSIAVSIVIVIVAAIATAITALSVIDAGEYVYSPRRPTERAEVDRLALLKGLINLLSSMGPLPIWIEIDVHEYVVEGCRPSDVLALPILVVSDEVVSSANRRDGLVSETLVDWVDSQLTKVLSDEADIVGSERWSRVPSDELLDLAEALAFEEKLLADCLSFIEEIALRDEEGPLYLLSDEGLDGSCWDLLTLVEEEGYAPTFIN